MTVETNRGAWYLVLSVGCMACASPPQECPGNGQGLTVTVVDDQTGLYVCNATVTATNGSIRVTGKPTGSAAPLTDAGCFYDLYPSEAGDYQIVATAAGYTMKDPPTDVAVSVGACAWNVSVDPSAVTITLVP